MTDSCAPEVEMSTNKLKRHTSPGTDQHPAELIKIGGMTIPSEIINVLIIFGIRRNCLRSGKFDHST